VSLLAGPVLGWIVLAAIAAIVEVSVPHLGMLFVAIGAIGAAVAAAAGMVVPVQVVVFAAVLAGSVLALRSRLAAGLGSRGVPSRTDSLIGKDGVVTHDIDPTTGGGRVNVGGEDWAARSAESVPAGARVRIVAADGIVLEVRRQ
jgi:inner membrane protein